MHLEAAAEPWPGGEATAEQMTPLAHTENAPAARGESPVSALPAPSSTTSISRASGW